VRKLFFAATPKRKIRFWLNFAKFFGVASTVNWWNKIRGSVSSFPSYKGSKFPENSLFSAFRGLTTREGSQLQRSNRYRQLTDRVQRRWTRTQSTSSKTGDDRTWRRWYRVQFRTKHHAKPTLTLATPRSFVARNVMLQSGVGTGSLSKVSKNFTIRSHRKNLTFGGKRRTVRFTRLSSYD
jgi:hypothetical protein